MIAPVEAYDRGKYRSKAKHLGQAIIAPEPAREATGIWTSKLIGDNPIIAVVSAITLGVVLGLLVKRKLG